jgi:hypothetical protein
MVMSEYWDQRYRRLEEGEIVRSGDDVLLDKDWEPAVHSIGKPAPSPHFTSHRWYRRLKTRLEHIEGAINDDILAMTPEEILEEARVDGEDTAEFASRMDDFVSRVKEGAAA